MTQLIPGTNAVLTKTSIDININLPSGVDIDVSAFALYDTGKTRGDGDMCFFNQPEIADGAIRMTGKTGKISFAIDLSRIPSDVAKISITATVDGRTFDGLQDIEINMADGPGLVIPTEGRTEAALILAEIYRHKGTWKIRNVSQGFDGGLAALATHFGMDVAKEEPATVPAPATNTVDLTKRLVSLEKKAPAMVSLVKSVGICLEKRGSTIPRSKVCLCLDISGSMSSLFRSGKIDTLVQRALALGLTFDDDGEIDVFLFGRNVHAYGTVTADNYTGFSSRALRDHPLEGGTRYGAAMEAIRKFYAPGFSDGLPVFVFFVTDGSTDDKQKTLKMLKDSASEPIFWKYMSLIPKGMFSASRTGFLQELDDLPGRVVDNADFFNITDPAAPSPEEFFDEVLDEFPTWIESASSVGILIA